MTREEYIDALIRNSPPPSPEVRARLEVLFSTNSEAGPASPAIARIHKDTPSDNKDNGQRAA